MATTSALTLRQIEYFVAVAELGSISAAAQHCMVSPSAVSMSIAQLETRLDVSLFHRTPSHRLAVSAAGKKLLSEARGIVSRVEEFLATASDLTDNIRGRLPVGCTETLTPYLLPRVLPRLSELHPGLEIDFVEGSVEDVRTLMTDGVCELAVTYWPREDPEFTAIRLYDLHVHLILPMDHRLAGRPVVSLADIADETAVLLDSPPSADLFLTLFADAGFTPARIKRARSIDTVRALVAGGTGYAPLLNRQAEPIAANGQRFAVTEIRERLEPVGVYLVTPRGQRMTRNSQAMIDFCLSELRG